MVRLPKGVAPFLSAGIINLYFSLIFSVKCGKIISKIISKLTWSEFYVRLYAALSDN